ncbi:MAG: hypothetical protein ACK56I_14650, partial [bacterium]
RHARRRSQRGINEAILHRNQSLPDPPVRKRAKADPDRRIWRPRAGTFRRGGTRAAPSAAQVPGRQASHHHGHVGSEGGAHRLSHCSRLPQAVAGGDFF